MQKHTLRRLIGAGLAPLFFPLFLASCGGGGSDAPAPTTPPTPPAPPAPTLITTAYVTQTTPGGFPFQLSASASDGSAVTWQLAAGSPGSLSATTGGTVVYTPPASGIAAPTTATVTASAGGVSKPIRIGVYPDPGTPRVELIAGSLGSLGVLDGTGTAARFARIRDLSFNARGEAIVADAEPVNESYSQTVVRRVTTPGVVTSSRAYFSGSEDGAPGTASIDEALSLAPGRAGDVYVLAQGADARRVRVIHADESVGTVLDAARTPQDAVRLVTDAAGTLYVVGRHGISRANNGTTTLVAGGTADATPRDGTGAAAVFGDVIDAALGTDGRLYVLDRCAVRAVDPATGRVTTVAGRLDDTGRVAAVVDGTGTAARFSWPTSLTATAGGVLVLDKEGSAPDEQRVIRRVTAAGVVTSLARVADPVVAARAPVPASPTPHTLLRAAPDGTLLLASRGEIWRGTAQGNFAPLAGLEGDSLASRDGTGAAARFVRPHALANAADGTLYLLEAPGDFFAGNAPEVVGLTVRRIATDGTVTTFKKDEFGSEVATGIVAMPDGSLVISRRVPVAVGRTTAGGAVYRLSPQGQLTLLAGAASAAGYGNEQRDGTGAEARFTRPVAYAADQEGNVYVADELNNFTNLRRITPQGVVTTQKAGDGTEFPQYSGRDAYWMPDGVGYTVGNRTLQRFQFSSVGIYPSPVVGVSGQPGPRLGTIGGESPALLNQPVTMVQLAPRVLVVIDGGAVLRVVVPPCTATATECSRFSVPRLW
ncbi:hypothetical protein [Pseudoduganella umbonata]|uniref:Uncharacterized protein n=1 Tax=Pseudoduganella umbonata TaxID=864828 RepID=A0A4P8HT43_9BURK|nr:hypothetical protein [Pseudoduganella umbonata]MBB3220678.1 hypothetical protein [Pseudoduganella umbonata]QCP11838.1 hypothetical protein FCL38_16480 [Pseudoduganella umbonata]